MGRTCPAPTGSFRHRLRRRPPVPTRLHVRDQCRGPRCGLGCSPDRGWPRCVRLRLRGRRAATSYRGGVQLRRRAASRPRPPPGDLGRGLPVPAGRVRRTRAARSRSLSRAGPVRSRHRADRHWAAGPLLSARDRSPRRHRLRQPTLQPTLSGSIREPPPSCQPIPWRLARHPRQAALTPSRDRRYGVATVRYQPWSRRGCWGRRRSRRGSALSVAEHRHCAGIAAIEERVGEQRCAISCS